MCRKLLLFSFLIHFTLIPCISLDSFIGNLFDIDSYFFLTLAYKKAKKQFGGSVQVTTNERGMICTKWTPVALAE